MKKFALIVICAAVVLPSIARAFLFGVTLTDMAGMTIAAATPAQTGTIVSVGLIGSALLFALGRWSGDYYKFPNYLHRRNGGFGGPYYIEQDSGYYYPTNDYYAQGGEYSSQYGQYNSQGDQYNYQGGQYSSQSDGEDSDGNLTPTSSYDSISPYYTDLDHTRRRRRANQEEENELDFEEVFDTLLGNIYASKIEGCFQRLVCDIAARPEDFPQHSPMLQGIEMMANQRLNSTEATSVSRQLLEAVKFGRNTTVVKDCETAFNDCYWSGQQMDTVISKFDNQVSIEA